MKKLVQVMAVAMVGFLGARVAQATLLLSDNFYGDGSGADYGLNENLGIRQGGSLAPLTYTRISGAVSPNENSVQVNGQLNLVGMGGNHNPAVSVGPFVSNIRLTVTGTSVGADDWLTVNVLAAATPAVEGTYNNGTCLLLNKTGGWALYEGGNNVRNGSGIPDYPTYNITIDVYGNQDLISATVNGDALFTLYPVTNNQGDYVWLGKSGSGTTVFNDLEITVPEPTMFSLFALGLGLCWWRRRR